MSFDDMSLEEKLLIEKLNADNKDIFIKIISKAFIQSIIVLFGVIFGLILIFYMTHFAINLEFALFVTSGIIFLVAGIRGSATTSPSINQAIEILSGKEKDKEHQQLKMKKALGSSIYYSLIAVFVGIYSVITFFIFS